MVNKENEELVKIAQKKWANTVLEIGKAYKKINLDDLVYKLLHEIYAFNHCDVLFKPTLAKDDQFRTTGRIHILFFLDKIKYARKIRVLP